MADDPPHRRAEVGYALARAAWGRGYVAEALHAMIGFAFETLALHRLEADVDPRNERSIRALLREGFEREGYLRERYHVSGEVQDAVLFGLLRREWSAREAEARRR
ncbi:MAG TPA: GNAT family protein [Gemmatimonadaceae bacterium]